MYTNDNDLYFLLTILNITAYFIAPALLISALLIFSETKVKKLHKKALYITASILLIASLVLGTFAYSGSLKPRCCGEGYALNTSHLNLKTITLNA